MLSQTAEYALRAVSALAARPNELIPTSELAKAADVPPPYLAKVLQQLASAGVIKGRRGVGGGYKLVRHADDITMLDVVNAVSPFRRARTPEELAADSGFGPLDQALDSVQGMVVTRFDGITIAQVRQRLDSAGAGVPDTANNGGSTMAAQAVANGHHENGHHENGRHETNGFTRI